MNLFKLLLLALLAYVPLSCAGMGGGAHSGIKSERVQLDGSGLSGEILDGAWNDRKLWLKVVFQNNGTQTLSFKLSQIHVDINGTRVPARGFLGGSMEADIDLLPSQVKTKKYGFHYRDFGIAGPLPGSYVLSVPAIHVAGAPNGENLAVPFVVP